MIEVALVFDRQGETLSWHRSKNPSASYIEDSHDLWTFLWDNRNIVGGVAHTHPWDGPAWPSHTDVTTFSAIERGLGVRLVWPVITFSDEGYFAWSEEEKNYVRLSSPPIRVVDVQELRHKSK
jgi:proteasome lid subunit RPN8/RPN11